MLMPFSQLGRPSFTILDRFQRIHLWYEDAVDTEDDFNANAVDTLIECHNDRQEAVENMWNEFRDALPVYEFSLRVADPNIMHTLRLLINRAESEWIRMFETFNGPLVFDDEE